MIRRYSLPIRLGTLIALGVYAVLATTGCASRCNCALLAKALSVQMGMSRDEVWKMLGEPRREFHTISYYGKPIKYHGTESPYVSSELTIYYGSNGVEQLIYFDKKISFERSANSAFSVLQK